MSKATILRVAVFGGTFDPFTNGHLEVIKSLVQEFQLVYVVPSVEHAFKRGSTSAHHRINMMELALEAHEHEEWMESTIPQPDVERQILKEHAGPVCTYQVLDRLQQPDLLLNFVIGKDLVPEIETWDRFDYIEKTYGFHVVKDSGVHATEVREMIKSGSPKQHPYWEDLVPEVVANYIKLHGLYRDDDD